MKMNKKLFYAMSRRRVSDPQITQQLWDAIKTIRLQRHVPDIDRIAKYMLKTFNVSHEEVVRQLGYCVRDGLLEQVKRMCFKGSKVGVEQEGYKLPQETMKKDSHDWYCFECHHGGDVISCNSCHRVYHLACIAKEELPETDVKHKFKCSVCKMCEERDQSFEIKKSKLNRLLRFTCNHMKERMPGCITDRPTVPVMTGHVTDRWASATPRRSASEVPNTFKWVTDDKDEWRKDYLIHRYMDLPMMQSKVESGKYEYLEEFKADAQTVVHNVVILHGVHSIKADEARLMLRDCLNDLQEIRQCRDCYRYSNDKTSRLWFCKPCKPPHTLVYAKQKGSAYWPAKVIKIDGDTYDVRFFGGQHEHVVVDKAYIRPISVNIHTLQVKKSSAWNKACEELKKHQKLLDKLRSVTNNFTLPVPESSSSSEDEDEEEEEEVEEVKKKEVKEAEPEDEEDEKSQSCSEEPATRKSSLSAAKGKKKKNTKANKKPSSIVADEEQSSPTPKRKGRPKKSDVVTPKVADKIEQEESSVASEDVLVSPPEKDDEKVATPQEPPSGLRKRGRPPGSKNKTPTKKILLEKKSGSQKSKKSSSAKNKKKASKVNDSSEEDDEDGDDEEEEDEEEEEEDVDEESSSKDVKEEDKEDLEPMELTEETKNEENTEDGEDEDSSKDELGPPQLQHGPSSKKESPISSTTLSPPHLVKKEEEEMVSSSSQEPQVRSVAVQAKITEKKSQEKPSKELISRIRAELDFEKQKEFERELEKVNNDHLVELNMLREKHALQISDTKKKQWCYNCEAEAIYHCCWNTAYCSTECQQLHWQKEHKRVCRRKR